MKVYLASDHAGFELKESLVAFLRERSVQVEDLGPTTFEPEDDYPDFVTPLAVRIASEPGAFGVALGASGQGEAIAANRIRGARAAVFYGGTMEILTASREHNNANILSLGARFITPQQAQDAVWMWLNAPFSNEERHARRIKKLDI